MPTSAFSKLNSPKNITTMPAVLKNIADCAFLWIPTEPKLNRARTGSVPRAKADMMSAPATKLPVVRVYICIDCVKPHGRKNVAIPTRIGVSV